MLNSSYGERLHLTLDPRWSFGTPSIRGLRNNGRLEQEIISEYNGNGRLWCARTNVETCLVLG